MIVETIRRSEELNYNIILKSVGLFVCPSYIKVRGNEFKKIRRRKV
jgi:hypothetical protein